MRSPTDAELKERVDELQEENQALNENASDDPDEISTKAIPNSRKCHNGVTWPLQFHL